MPFDRGRFHPSAEGAKAGITLLVPRPVIDEEQEQILQMILTARVQQLIIHLRRGGIRHLDINEILRRGEFKGYAPLHVCVMRGTSSVVAALLELAQADPNVPATDVSREMPLHLAAAKGDVGMVRALLHHGASPDATEAHLLTPLLVAAKAGEKGSFHHLVAAELIKANASLTARDPEGNTPIHAACATELALPLVNEMCGRGSANADAGLSGALEAINKDGEGVLHRALSKGQPEVAHLLIKCGARVDARSSSGDTAMHCAARSGLDTVALMLAGAEHERPKALNASNLAGETPLHLAMSGSSAAHARIARMLLDRGAYAFGRTRSGESVLHACAREGNDLLAKMVLMRQEKGASEALNARSIRGGTPLHVAVAHNQPRMVALLLAQPEIDRSGCDGEGNTTINIACLREDIVLLQQLLSSGKGVEPHELEVRNTLGWAPLHTASFRGQEAAVRMLLRWGAPVDHKTSDGWTALHLAASEGHACTCRALLDGGASLDETRPSGESALGLAAARGRHATIKVLLGAGASAATPCDEHGWTPMHAALATGDSLAAVSLLDKGGRLRAKPESKGGRGAPPVGDAIDLAPSHLRRVVLEADERRRRIARKSGRDSDDDDDDDSAAPWDLQSTASGTSFFDEPRVPIPVQLLLPTVPYEQRRSQSSRGGRNLFGHYG